MSGPSGRPVTAQEAIAETQTLRTKTRTWWRCPGCGRYGDFTSQHPDDAAWNLGLIARNHEHAPAVQGQAHTGGEQDD